MYVPKHFAETDPAFIKSFVQQNAFGTLVNWDGKRPIATQLLMNIKGTPPSELVLNGHMAKMNPQWKVFDERSEALALFEGPHAYISASWYSIDSAPTWNYVTVHAYGTPRIVEGRKELYGLLKELVDSQEGRFPEQRRYKIESMPKDMLENMMNSIVGFEIHVTHIECVTKLSQNRSNKDYDHIIHMLKEQGDAGSVSIAKEMEKRIRTRNKES